MILFYGFHILETIQIIRDTLRVVVVGGPGGGPWGPG
jgi:hypothetical protein